MMLAYGLLRRAARHNDGEANLRLGMDVLLGEAWNDPALPDKVVYR